MSKRIKGITIEINAETKGLDKALQDVNKSSRDINKELREVNKSLRFNPKNTEILSQKQKLLGDQVATTREKLDRLKAAQEQVNEQFKKGEISEENYRKFQREIVETESKLKHYEKQLREVSDSHVILGERLQDTGKKLGNIGDKLSTAGKNMTKKLTVPIVGVAGAAAKLGIDFDRSMSKVASVTGATGEELQQLEDAAREAGKTTNKSASDAADALYEMGLAGWSVGESQSALLPMLKLSSTANMDLGQATNMVVAGLNTMGMEIEDTERYLDVIAQTSRSSATDIDELGEAFQAVGGRLSLLGVEVEEGAVALGAMANAGIVGSEAGRGLNAVLTNLTAPTGQAKKALDELGISAFDSNGEFIGIEETLMLVEGALEGMTQEQQNAYLSMISGKEHAKSLDALMKGLGGGFDELGNEIGNADGALNKMYDTVTGDTMGSIENLKSALEELALKLWNNLKPSIDWLVEKLQIVTDKFNALTPEQQENIVKIGLMVAAIGPLISILGRTSQNISSMITLGGKLAGNWDKIRGVGSTLAGGLGKTVGFIFSPAGAIVAGIAAAIAIGVALYKNWDKIKEKATALWTSLKGTFDKIKNFLKGIFDFKWELPKLKLPKISIEGKFSLVPPSVPKFSIKWNKEGGIFKNPTVLPTLQGLQGFAEPSTGGEAIVPLNKLVPLMADAIEQAGGTGKTINFYGNYNFRDSRDIDYFMEQAELRLLRGEI